MKETYFGHFMKTLDFNGKIERKAFWWLTIIYIAIAQLLIQVLPILSIQLAPLFYTWAIIPIIAQISLNIRRLHDVGKNGWFQLVPVYSFYLYIQPSKE